MYWHRAMHTENNLVMVLIVATSTNSAASVVLCDLGSLELAYVLNIVLKLQPLGLIDFLAVCNSLVHLFHLIHDLPIPHLVAPLLRQF